MTFLASSRLPYQQPQRLLTVGMGMLLSFGLTPADRLLAEETSIQLPPPAWLQQNVPPLMLQSGSPSAFSTDEPLLPEGGGFSVMELTPWSEFQSPAAPNITYDSVDRPSPEATIYQSPYYQAALSSGELGFSPPPTLVKPDWKTFDSDAAAYDSRADVPTERPWIEWGRPFYGPGMIPPGGTFFGPFNLLHPTFYVYGDFRLGASTGQNALGRIDNVATRLNLEMDLAITATERFHALISPLNQANDVTHIRFDDDRLVPNSAFNADFVTGFFEGDLGYMIGGVTDSPADFELPVALGLLPLLYQNGIWMDDAVTGIAISRNARHSRALNWSNYDASVFAIVDQINSPAFGADANAAQAVGTAWFIEAYGGYIESGWAYVHDRKDLGRSYHNWTVSFTRRYFDRIGNSVRLIVNSGQDLQQANQTADGGLLIIENNWITAQALTFVPYWNVFYGWGRPQSIARNAIAGGILRNIGINFETDALNGYPTLDDTGHNTAGGAIGVNLLGSSLERQIILEASMVQSHDFDNRQRLPGNEYGLGMRYQVPLSNCTLLRFDTMYGWREHREDVFGARAEFRYKF